MQKYNAKTANAPPRCLQEADGESMNYACAVKWRNDNGTACLRARWSMAAVIWRHCDVIVRRRIFFRDAAAADSSFQRKRKGTVQGSGTARTVL